MHVVTEVHFLGFPFRSDPINFMRTKNYEWLIIASEAIAIKKLLTLRRKIEYLVKPKKQVGLALDVN